MRKCVECKKITGLSKNGKPKLFCDKFCEANYKRKLKDKGKYKKFFRTNFFNVIKVCNNDDFFYEIKMKGSGNLNVLYASDINELRDLYNCIGKTIREEFIEDERKGNI